jgi:hypothetical protein
MNPLRVSRIAGAILALCTSSAMLTASPLTAQSTRPARATTGAAWLTRPELTDYAGTSRYDEVIAYMRQMVAASPQIHLTTYGYTTEGRPLPLAVIGAPGASVAQVLATGKTRVYIQANIHAGEVQGKEATLWLLRSIARGERNAWLRTTVLMINPMVAGARVVLLARACRPEPVLTPPPRCRCWPCAWRPIRRGVYSCRDVQSNRTRRSEKATSSRLCISSLRVSNSSLPPQ